MIAIIDYSAGNIRSVKNALERLGAPYVLTADEATLRQASHVILPGVGEASSAMEQLRQRGLDTVIPTLTQPVLGICIGMQLLCKHSEEGDCNCLGVFDTNVRKLNVPLPVPHTGWDTVSRLKGELYDGIPEDTYIYYVHSFAAEPCAQMTAETTYGVTFAASLRNGNFHGVQFHPEKSGDVGAKILANFLKID